jgi:hypothetical protein
VKTSKEQKKIVFEVENKTKTKQNKKQPVADSVKKSKQIIKFVGSSFFDEILSSYDTLKFNTTKYFKCEKRNQVNLDNLIFLNKKFEKAFINLSNWKSEF